MRAINVRRSGGGGGFTPPLTLAAKQGEAKQDRAWPGKARHSKTRQGKESHGKARRRQGKGRKARQGKAIKSFFDAFSVDDAIRNPF